MLIVFISKWSWLTPIATRFRDASAELPKVERRASAINPRHGEAGGDLPQLSGHLVADMPTIYCGQHEGQLGGRLAGRCRAIPRFVMAGVPRRSPLVTWGWRWSKGMAFLLAMIPTASEACSA